MSSPEEIEREALARAYDPDAFEPHPAEQRRAFAAIQWAARRKLATDAAERAWNHGYRRLSESGCVDLDAIRARAEAATPGPWNATGSSHDDDGLVTLFSDDVDADDPVAIVAPSDAEFIAHARVDISALLAEVERLRLSESEIRREPISDAEVDAVAYVMFEPAGGVGDYTWAEMVREDPTRADIWRTDARAALEAARAAKEADRG